MRRCVVSPQCSFWARASPAGTALHIKRDIGLYYIHRPFATGETANPTSAPPTNLVGHASRRQTSSSPVRITYSEWEDNLREQLREIEAEIMTRVGYSEKQATDLSQASGEAEEMSELERLLRGIPSERSQEEGEAKVSLTEEKGEELDVWDDLIASDEIPKEEDAVHRVEVFDKLLQDEKSVLFDSEYESEDHSPEEFLDLTAREPEDLPFPYRLLDWRWYKRTDEDERIRQLLKWKPFSRRGAEQLAQEEAFKKNPFASSSPLARSPWELEQYRRARLENFFSDQLGRLAELMDNPYQGQIVRNEEFRVPTVMSFKESTTALLIDLRIIDRRIREAKLTKQDAQQVEEEIRRLEEDPVSAKDRSRILKEVAQSEEIPAKKNSKKDRKRLCPFCKPAGERPILEPMNLALLLTFLTPAGDIIPRAFNGNCATHQRRVAKTIKQARTLGLFSSKHGTFTAISPFHLPKDADSALLEMKKEKKVAPEKLQEFEEVVSTWKMQ